MRCRFEVDDRADDTWTEERELPLVGGEIVIHGERAYEITEGPRFEADIESATMSAVFVVTVATPR